MTLSIVSHLSLSYFSSNHAATLGTRYHLIEFNSNTLCFSSYLLQVLVIVFFGTHPITFSFSTFANFVFVAHTNLLIVCETFRLATVSPCVSSPTCLFSSDCAMPSNGSKTVPSLLGPKINSLYCYSFFLIVFFLFIIFFMSFIVTLTFFHTQVHLDMCFLSFPLNHSNSLTWIIHHLLCCPCYML